MNGNGTYTGRKRNLRTKAIVRWTDRIARLVITVGGIGTIVAVSTVGVFLAIVVAPLFFSATLEAKAQHDRSTNPAAEHMGMDESGKLTWALTADGKIEVWALETGQMTQRIPLATDAPIRSSAFLAKRDALVLGLANGSVQLLRFKTANERRASPVTGDPPGGYAYPNPDGSWQVVTLVPLVEPAIPLSPGKAIVRVDSVAKSGFLFVAALDEAEALWIHAAEKKKNLITGKDSAKSKTVRVPYAATNRGAPDRLLAAANGENVYLAWWNGDLLRFDTADLERPRLAESTTLIDPGAGRLTRLTFAAGLVSLLAGDSRGEIGVWFPARPTPESPPVLTKARTISVGALPITTLASSGRSRLAVTGDSAGKVHVIQTTTGESLVQVAASGPATNAMLSTKEDALLVWTDRALEQWRFAARHPEAGLRSLFLPVWYEQYPAPAHEWQSTSAAEDAEPKFGLIPLVFGTLKATIYSMLFAVPIALLAAIYTSEFLAPHWRARIKPVVELMASLPSVVLGFLAALVFAPLVAAAAPTVLAAFVTVPFVFALAAYLAQLFPEWVVKRAQARRLVFLLLLVPLGLVGAALVGPLADTWLFDGSFRLWLDGRGGRAQGGWLLILLPLCSLATMFVMGRFVQPWLQDRSAGWSRLVCGIIDLMRFLLGAFATVLLALVASWALEWGGLDPRAGMMGTYVQRNALVVGFVMGFAVIPLIYTLAEDAFSAVPDHLRSASLGAGATPWQTATRIVFPTALSGVFSAIMVGLGRAVGETMIVLMAAGNTPLLDWNIFNGFRTLSANLAVELPEAVRDSTHYRTLFLAALVLFLLTFCLNTIAEIVRQRFRRRAYQL